MAMLLLMVMWCRRYVFAFQDGDRLTQFALKDSEKRKLELTVDTWAARGLQYLMTGDASPDDAHAEKVVTCL
jgi:hypothetical protein